MQPSPPRASLNDKAILRLHSAIDRDGLWTAVRELLKGPFRGRRVTLFLGHLDMGDARVVYTDPPIEEAARWYDERGKLNPFSPFIERNIGRRYYHFHEVVGPPAEFKRTGFYQRFARIEGWDKGISVMFWERAALHGMFSIYRAPRQRDFSDAEVAELLEVAQHIEIAIGRVLKIDHEEGYRSSLESILRTLPAALMFVDWDLKPLFTNLAAAEMAALWNYGRDHARRFNPRACFRMPSALTAALRACKDEIRAIQPKLLHEQWPGARTVVHPQDGGLTARIRPAQLSRGAVGRPGFYIIFQEPLAAIPEADSVQRAHFRERALQELTPAERKVVARLCLGYRNDRIASELNKSVLTVKSQLNSIFQKLGIKSRAELVARMK